MKYFPISLSTCEREYLISKLRYVRNASKVAKRDAHDGEIYNKAMGIISLSESFITDIQRCDVTISVLNSINVLIEVDFYELLISFFDQKNI